MGKMRVNMVLGTMLCLSLLAIINAEQSNIIKSSELVGNTNGTFWSDEKIYLKSDNSSITKIQIASSKTMNGFRIRYGNYWGQWHGGNAGVISSFDIGNITSIRGVEHQSNKSLPTHIMSIEFTSFDGTRFGPFGRSGGIGKKYNKHLKGCNLVFVSGYTGPVYWLLKIKGIVFHWICRSTKLESSMKETGIIGSKTGMFWSDEDVYHKEGKITGLQIAARKTINALRVRYNKTWGKWHGGTSGITNAFDIGDISSIRGVEIQGNETLIGYIRSMEFTTIDGSRYGPFGDSKGKGEKYNKHIDGCHVAYISGYTGPVGWLMKVTGIIFHWVCETSSSTGDISKKMFITMD